MMKRIPSLLFLVTLVLSACNLSIARENKDGDIAATSTVAPPSATPEGARPLPSETPHPTVTASPTPTEDPTPASMRSSAGDLICRFGPGRRYGVGGSLLQGVNALITARNGAGDWFQFELPGYPGKYCWLPANEVELTGDLKPLPIAEAPPSFVTHVSVVIDPLIMEPATCVFPLTFNVTFTIETIGPTLVTFQRSQSNGLSAPAETVEFTEAGPKVFEDYLRADAAGEHWFKITVSSPNGVVGQGIGTVVCP